MARRTPVPTPAPHAPTGSFAPPPEPQGLVCWCDAALTRVSNEATDPRGLDWKVVDEQGRTFVDWTPTFRYRLPDGEVITIDMHDADAWDRLAKVDIGKYSMLKVRLDLGGSFYHPHREDTSKSAPPPVLDVDPPKWAAPDGWRCRTAPGEPALVPYSEAGEGAA
jgi:hypothetical protein